MKRRWGVVAALFLGVATLLVFVSSRIADRDRILDGGTTVLMPLAPLGPRDLSLGERIELVYALPGIEADLLKGGWMEEGVLHVTLDGAGAVTRAALNPPDSETGRTVVVNYRFVPSGTGLLTSDRQMLSFGESYFLVPGGRAADYLHARYAVLRVDGDGSSVVTGLADGEGELIRPGR